MLLHLTHFLNLTQIIDVMDRIEDEIEAHAYEDLVPLELKLALEDKVFGWSHLTSAFLGHTMFTVGSYYAVYGLVTLLLDYVSEETLPFPGQWLRVGLSLWASVITYRMVRRRRRVWFRAPYGSKAYREDTARRRQSVRETDRFMSRMLQRFRHRRVLKRLRKAETQFTKKLSQKAQEDWMQSPGTSKNTLIEEKEDMLEHVSPLKLSMSTSEESDDSSSSLNSSESATSSSKEEKYDSSAPLKSRKRPRRPSFHTKPTQKMESWAHDQILFPSIHRMPYAHGGFFGAAPFLLTNPHWISILRHYLPDVYVEISRRVAYSPASKLIHWAENNPVVAAYGAAHNLEYSSSGIPNLEWDVFLDPKLVARVQVVLDEKEKYLSTGSANISGKQNDKEKEHVLAYYEKELEDRSQALVDEMLIAHGKSTQIIMEQTGYAKHFNYSRIKRTRRTLGGGIFARQWMAIFAEALRMGLCLTGNDMSEGDTTNDAVSPRAATQKHKSTSCLKTLTETACPDATMEESVHILESIVKEKQPLGLYMDLKSRHVSKRIWGIVIDTLRKNGIRIEGFGSFFNEDIRGVSQLCQEPVDEINYFHSAGDLQQACLNGKIQSGDKVFFNAGCLLWDPKPAETALQAPCDFWKAQGSFNPQVVKERYRVQPFGLPSDETTPFATIQMYKTKFNLSVGVYCQEFAIDEAAATILVELVNTHKDLYDLGFSWGGINGITIQGICPGRFTATDGFWNQRYLGYVWDYTLLPSGQAIIRSTEEQ